jgi:hypothetical protein
MNNVRNMIIDVQWVITGDSPYLGGWQEGYCVVLDLEGKRKWLNSAFINRGGPFRQTLDDLSDQEWSLLQAEYDKLMTVETTRGYALREYKPSKGKSFVRKKVYRLF